MNVNRGIRLKAWLDGELDQVDAARIARAVEDDLELRRARDEYLAIAARIRAAEGERPLRTIAAICAAAGHARRDEQRIVRLLKRWSAVAAVLLVSTAVFVASNASSSEPTELLRDSRSREVPGPDPDGLSEFLYVDEGVATFLTRDF